jgi:hypothetical protein
MGKSRDKSRQKRKVICERQDRVRFILKALGIWERLRRTTLGDQILRAYYPRITVRLANDVPKTSQTDSILRSLNKIIDKVTISCAPFGGKYPVVDVVSFVMPVVRMVHRAYSNDRELSILLREARQQTSDLATPEMLTNALKELYHELEVAILHHCRIDSGIYHLEFAPVRDEKKDFKAIFILHMSRPRVQRVTTESGTRPAYWCGQSYGSHGVAWIEWPRSLMGLNDEGPGMPVYVQGHALDNLYRKEARALFLEDGEWIVHDYLWSSLNKPNVIIMPNSPGKFLVEYYLSNYKIGYLVARPVGDLVLIETFLFLTMNGTPEGDLLWRKLRLRREDKSFLGLDKIQTYLFSDVQIDPGLVSLLEECGCGHLFRIMREPPRERLIAGHAERMRRYLSLAV